jgi:hypothetical protein
VLETVQQFWSRPGRQDEQADRCLLMMVRSQGGMPSVVGPPLHHLRGFYCELNSQACVCPPFAERQK